MEKRRLEQLADFDAIRERELKLRKKLQEEKDKKKAMAREIKGKNSTGYNANQIWQRKFMKVKDFLHMSKKLLRFFVVSEFLSLFSLGKS